MKNRILSMMFIALFASCAIYNPFAPDNFNAESINNEVKSPEELNPSLTPTPTNIETPISTITGTPVPTVTESPVPTASLTPTPTPAQLTSGDFDTISGSWSTVTNTLSGETNDYFYTCSKNDFIDFTFTGTQIICYGLTTFYSGIIEVTVEINQDPSNPSNVLMSYDLQTASNTYGEMFRISNLPYGTHRMTVSVTENKDFYLDYFLAQ